MAKLIVTSLVTKAYRVPGTFSFEWKLRLLLDACRERLLSCGLLKQGDSVTDSPSSVVVVGTGEYELLSL